MQYTNTYYIDYESIRRVNGVRELRPLDYVVCDGKLVARVEKVVRDPDNGKILSVGFRSDPVYAHVRHALK